MLRIMHQIYNGLSLLTVLLISPPILVQIKKIYRNNLKKVESNSNVFRGVANSILMGGGGGGGGGVSVILQSYLNHKLICQVISTNYENNLPTGF
jgi:hypothetical protein